MRKILAFVLVLIFVLSLAACGSNKNKADNTQQTDEQTKQTEQTVQTAQTETVYIAAETDDFEKYGLDYGLEEADINLVRNLYSQISENYMTLQDSNTEKFTRNPIDIWMVSIVYFGEEPIIGCHYYYMVSAGEKHEFALAFEMDDKGDLSNIDFDILQFISANRNDFGTTDGDIVITDAQIGTPTIGETFPMKEEDKINYITKMYSNYKMLRQEKYGDVYDKSDSYLSKLDEKQIDLLDNILDSEEEWGYYYDNWNDEDKPCIYIGIWDFGDGSAELLCTHGTVQFHNESSGQTQYSGSNHGYFIDDGTVSSLDDQALKRLENDLSKANKLYWSPEWADKVKEEKLAEYIFNLKL